MSGFRLVHLKSIDSTNSEAMRRLAAGAAPGEIILADQQTGGRGSRGRGWASNSGDFFASVTVPLSGAHPPSDFAFVTAVAAGDAINPLLPKGMSVAFKWPNDILVNSRKLAGILIEIAEKPGAVAVIGIGINLKTRPANEEFNAVGLAELGTDIDADTMAALFCESLSIWLDRWRDKGLGDVLECWRHFAAGIGEAVRVELADGSIASGVFSDIDETGRMVLQMANGAIQHLSTGDVFFQNFSDTCC